MRAAKLAALEEVPVRVVDSRTRLASKPSWLKIFNVKNATSVGKEAFAFYGLLHTDGLQYDITSLAAKTGKSPAFVMVAPGLRLVELHPTIAEAFLADEIGVGHALEISNTYCSKG